MDKFKRHCINLIVTDAVLTDSKDDHIASLLINGLGGVPLKEMTEEKLTEEVYSRLSYQFSPDESQLFEEKENDKKFKKWILKQSVKDWCGEFLI